MAQHTNARAAVFAYAANLMTTLPAFACGAAVAIFMLAGIEVPSAQSPGGAIYGCADSKGNLRLTEPAVPCRPGERRLRLSPPRIDEDRKCEEDNERAERLEGRIKDLEYRGRIGTLRRTRVTAPFEVVTKADKPVLRIDEENVTFYNRQTQVMARILADQAGGNFLARSSTGFSAQIGALGQIAGVLIQENDRDRIDLGGNAQGLYRLRVLGPKGAVVAGIGQNSQGSGLALVADIEGNTKALMNVPTTTGQLYVTNAKGTEVGFLTVGAGGDGRFELTDGAGNLMVQAGYTEGVGLLRTGPRMHNPAIGFLGLAPSSIMGQK